MSRPALVVTSPGDEGRGSLRRVLRNILLGLFTSLALRLLSPILLIVAARVLTKADFGHFSFALDYSTVALGLGVLGTGYGYAANLIRTGARDASRAVAVYPTMLATLAAGYAVVAVVALFVVRLFPGGASYSKTVMLLFLLAAGLTGLSGLTDAILRGMEAFGLVTARTLLQQVAVVVIGVGLLLLGLRVEGLAIAFAVGGTIGLVTGVMLLGRHFRPRWSAVSVEAAVRAWRSSFSLSTQYLLMDVYWRADSVLLGLLRGAVILAPYSAGYRLIYLYVAAMDAVGIALFPSLARARSPEQVVHLVRPMMGLLMTFGALVGVVLFSLHTEVIVLVFSSKYTDAGLIVQLMAISCVFMAGQRFANSALVALDHERVLSRVFPVVVIGNVAANLLLIPGYGYWAATWVMVATEVALFTAYLVLLTRRVGTAGPLSLALRVVAAWAVGTVTALGAALVLPSLLVVVPAVLAFGIALVLFRGLPLAEYAALGGRLSPGSPASIPVE